ncbi:MAG: helix-turn-helix transcriptional regulator [Lachnospiraceae bacterium]|nr:helix-turn-helix transcriptional regulator [Lachnospiraceae bacterium]
MEARTSLNTAKRTVRRKTKRRPIRSPKDLATSIAIIGSCVREGRLEKNLSQRALGERVGVGKRAIMDIEADIANPKFEVLYGLVREFEMPIYHIFYPDIPEDLEERRLLFEELEECSEQEMKIILPMVRRLKELLKAQRKPRGRKKKVKKEESETGAEGKENTSKETEKKKK